MATAVLDAYSKAYPSISNRIRASVFKENDLLAPIATIVEIAPHPIRIWHFPGLPRANYAFSLDEIDGGGNPINNLALFDVVPAQVNGMLSRADDQIRVDETNGLESGETSIFFNGGETAPGSGLFRPDYIGWDIVPSELDDGRGLMVRDRDYSWDSVTGEFVLLQVGDSFQHLQYYNIHFNPNNNQSSGSIPTVIDFSARVVTEDGNVDLSDFGNTIISEPDGDYLELQLPSILTVPQGRILTIETKTVLGSSVQCTKLLPDGADVINFLRGNIYIMSNESIQIYRFKRLDDSNEWRVRNTDGNFKTVGQSVGDDCIQIGVYCKQLMNGSIGDILKHARVYNEHVLNLPPTQVVNYDDWATGNNKYLFSLANSADPGNAGKFHFPDRRDLFERNNNAGKAGDFFPSIMANHYHTTGSETTDQDGGIYRKGIIHSNKGISPNTTTHTFAGSTGKTYLVDNSEVVTNETYPKHYLINKYVLI